MKALILAAGFGSRLRPWTETLPKPLFPVAGTPVILRMVRALEAAGCTEIAVNTHHLAPQLEAFLSTARTRAAIVPVFEPEILGTGGAIKNLQSFLDGGPFIVANADVVTDLDFKSLLSWRRGNPHPAVLVLHDHPPFNNVEAADGFVRGFSREASPGKLAFTGIQVLDPVVFDYLEPGAFQSSISAYEKMIQDGLNIAAYCPENLWWGDIGSPEGFSRACMEAGALDILTGNKEGNRRMEVRHLAGGGSTRSWSRVNVDGATLIAGDHGIRKDNSWNEADAYAAIGRHLKRSGAPVPDILGCDAFAGMVFVQDMGDNSLESLVRDSSLDAALPVYRQAARDLARMAVNAAKGFDTAWTCQTARYDVDLILEKESRYFFEAFVNGWLGHPARFEDFLDECRMLAEATAQSQPQGFVHRDFQSRNIMVHQGRGWFIDFQGGRLGPVQYDLASLLIDPYANLPQAVQDELTKTHLEVLSLLLLVDRESFMEGYHHCALHRNLQILGAFSHLTRVMGKPGFAAYIAPALLGLKERIRRFPQAPRLQGLIASLTI